MRCRWCVGFACELSARTGTHNTVIPTALASGNCELRTSVWSAKFCSTAPGRQPAWLTSTSTTRLQQQTADLVIVCAGAVESARLLLNTRHRLFPTGLGNRYDWVGRNLQGHSYTGASGLFESDTFDDIGPGASIAICDYNSWQCGTGGRRHAGQRVHSSAIHYVTGLPPWVPRWGLAAKEFIRQYYKRTIVVFGPVQEMPVFDARVEVDPKVKDAWGIPVARLSGGRHPHTIEIGKFLANKAETWLKEAGASRTWTRHPVRG